MTERRPEPSEGTEDLEPAFVQDIVGNPPVGSETTEVQPHPDFEPIPVPEPATDEDSAE